MPKFYFKKLVRDRVVNDCLVDPKVLDTIYTVLEGDEYRKELIKKVSEEAAEIPLEEGSDKGEALSEIADLQNVVDALREDFGFTEDEVRAEGKRKTAKKGGFSNKHFIDHVVLADDSEWIEVFRQQPDKYREVEE